MFPLKVSTLAAASPATSPGGTPRHGRTAAPLFLAALLSLLLSACGPDPVDTIKSLRIQADPSRTLGQIMESCPFFTKVLWTSYYAADGGSRARVSGILDLDGLLRKTSGIRIYSAKERAVLEKAGASLTFSMEFSVGKGAKGSREPVLTRMEMRIVAMGWDREASLTSDAILREVVAGKAGDAVMKAVLDAADYCRDRPPSMPGRN